LAYVTMAAERLPLRVTSR